MNVFSDDFGMDDEDDPAYGLEIQRENYRRHRMSEHDAASAPQQPTNHIQCALEQTLSKLRGLLAAKNADYGGGVSEFKNFDYSEMLMGVPAEIGILIRMSDKMSRLGGLLSGAEPQVKDEAIEDTIDDLVGYAVILKARRAARKETPCEH